MIIVRPIWNGVTAHFPARRSEWALASMMFTTGVILLHPGITFQPGVRLFQTLQAIASENAWGWSCLLFGAARLCALIVNGTFADTKYSQYSPHVRGGFAFLSMFYWATISIGLLHAATINAIPFGLGCYPFLLVLDMTNVYQAFLDAGRADRSARPDVVQ